MPRPIKNEMWIPLKARKPISKRGKTNLILNLFLSHLNLGLLKFKQTSDEFIREFELYLPLNNKITFRIHKELHLGITESM